MKKAVFLDRDGVINKAIVKNGKPCSPMDLNSVEIIFGVKDSLKALRDADWMTIVVTNQPDVARGKISKKEVEKINTYMKNTLPINEFYTCIHDNNDLCECRKPKPGELTLAAKNNNIDLNCSYMIGDRWKDIEAGKRAGCKTIFINSFYKEKQPTDYTFQAKSLSEAVKIILG